MAGVHVEWDEAALHDLLNSEDGPVGRDLIGKTEKVTQEAKRLAPVSPDGSNGRPSGYMRSQIDGQVTHDEEGLVGYVEAHADYSIYVEVGTGPHDIVSHGNYPLRNKKGQVFGKKVHHPGTQAQPFLRPAVDIIAAD